MIADAERLQQQIAFIEQLDGLKQVLRQNLKTRGGTWRIHNIDKARVIQRMLPIREGIPALWPVVEHYLATAVAQGLLRETPPGTN